MLSRNGLVRLTDNLQQTVATALGLLVISLAFVYLVPRHDEIADAMTARREAARALAAAEAERSPPPEATAAPASEVASGTPAETALPATATPSPPETPALAVPAAAPATGERQLLARPVVEDTATLLVRRGRVRLSGVQAAPLSRRCGEDGPRGWFCGVEARTRFRAWLRTRSVSCEVPAGFGEREEQIEARCDLAGEDVGNWLVENGYAEAAPGSGYADAQAKAKAAKVGLWAERRAAD